MNILANKYYREPRWDNVVGDPRQNPALAALFDAERDAVSFVDYVVIEGEGEIWRPMQTLRVTSVDSFPNGIAFGPNVQPAPLDQANYDVLVQAVYQDQGFLWIDEQYYHARNFFFRQMMKEGRTWQEQLEHLVQLANAANFPVEPYGFLMTDPQLAGPGPEMNTQFYEANAEGTYKLATYPPGTEDFGAVAPIYYPLDLSLAEESTFLAFAPVWVQTDKPGLIRITGTII